MNTSTRASRVRICLSVPLAMGAIGVVVMLATGVNALDTIALTILVAMQAVAGAYAWRVVRGSLPMGIIECSGMGLAIGSATSLLTGIFLRPLSPWAWLLFPVATLFIWIARRRRGRVLPPCLPPSASGTVALLIGGALGLLALLANLRNYPLSWSGTWDRYHPDMLFFEAMAQGLARFGPFDSILMAGGSLRYHWFTYAWAGQLSTSVDAGSFVVLTRVLPLVSLIGSVMVSIAWAQRLSKVWWVPSLAAVLLVSGGYVGATYGTILNFDSPSQALSTMWLLAACAVFLAFLRTPSAKRQMRLSSPPNIGLLATLGILVIAVSGGKISSAAMLLAAMAAVTVVGLMRREHWAWRAAVATVLSGFLLAATYLIVISGSADPGGLKILKIVDRSSTVQGLNPSNTPLGIVIGTLILLIAIIPRWSGVAWLATDPGSRQRPFTILGLGLALAGILTVIILSGGLNDTWFALAASAPLAVLGAVGVGRSISWVSPSSVVRPTFIIWLGVISGFALAGVVMIFWMTGEGSLRWTGPLIGLLGAGLGGLVLSGHRSLRGSMRARWLALTLLILTCMAVPSRVLGVTSGAFGTQSTDTLHSFAFSSFEPFTNNIDHALVTSWTHAEQVAAAWVIEQVPGDDIIATNVVFSPLVPALTRHRMLIAGLMDQAPYGTKSQIPDLLSRERISLDFISAPTESSAHELIKRGVGWVWIDRSRATAQDWAPWASVAFRNEAVTILRMNSA